MSHIHKIQHKTALLISIVMLLTQLYLPKQTNAQDPWPPFWFEIIPSYKNGKITYNIEFSSRVDWQISDLVITIPLPEGTRFLEARAQPSTELRFEGPAVTFFTSAVIRDIEETWFTVEITDPTITVFTTQSWLAWKGAQGGNYLAEPVSFDITRQPLNWDPPPISRLQLGVKAIVANNVIIYEIYPKAIDSRYRMWDVKINVPLPEGTTFLSVDAPPPFVTGFNGQEISFSTVELERQVEVGPLTFKISTTEVTQPVMEAYIWAAWKNGTNDPLPTTGPPIIYRDDGVDVPEPLPPTEESIIVDASVAQPHVAQQVVFDIRGDVPFPNYDLTSLAFRETGSMLTIIFNTAEDVGLVGQPVQYTLFLDSDCNSDTGWQVKHRGAEYRIQYSHETGRATITPWDTAQQDWDWSQTAGLNHLVDKNTVMLSAPYNLIGDSRKFCWVARALNDTEAFNPNPPRDWVPDEEYLKLTQYERVASNDAGIKGQLAVPLSNERGFYDVYIFSMSNGEEIVQIPNARQPNFRFDGQKLLTNHENNEAEDVFKHVFDDGRTIVYVVQNYSLTENIYEYDFAGDTEKQVSDSKTDSHPYYDPQGRQVVYGNSQLIAGADDPQPPYIFIQCSLLPPHQEVEELCRNLSNFRVLQTDPIGGSYPVWTDNDMIAYKGCDSLAKLTSCGIHLVDSGATNSSNNDVNSIQLTQEAGDIPSDTKNNLIAFTSQRDGNWEAYVMNLDGTGVINLSNAPNSNDALPTISPDGNWAAFVSDRNNQWAIWAAPITGGPAQKLFDLPDDTPWGSGEREWINERISWGP